VAKVVQKELWICVELGPKSNEFDVQTLEVIMDQLYYVSTKICYSLGKPLVVINVLFVELCQHQPHVTFKDCQVLLGIEKGFLFILFLLLVHNHILSI